MDLLKDLDWKALEEEYDYYYIAAHKKGPGQAFVAAGGDHYAIIKSFGLFINSHLNAEKSPGIDPLTIDDIQECLALGMMKYDNRDTIAIMKPKSGFVAPENLNDTE